jgi:alpha-mannosidase
MNNYKKVFLCPHSHIDITWWDRPETCRKRILEIINKVIYLSSKYPDYRFSLETTLPLYIYLQEFPEKKEEIKKLIENKNLEIGGLYVSAISDTCIDELIIRNLYFGKKYLKDELNYDVDFVKEEDVPGHTYQLPQILKSAKIKYLKISRGPQGLFLWCAKNGDKILTCLIDYGAIAQKRQKSIDSIISAIKRFLDKSQNIDKIEYPYILLPSGDDMEIPSEKIIDAKNLWNKNFKQPEIILGNFNEFIKEVENFQHKILKGDIPNIWAGIATMETMIVQDSLKGQRNLVSAEKFSTFSYLLNNDYPEKEISECYRKLLLVSDHNWGSRDREHFGEECDRYKLKLADEVKNLSKEILKNSLENICKKISFKENGIPIVVFNSLNFKRDDVVEVELQKGNYILKDNSGNTIPYQFEENKIVFVAKDVPGLGYKTYYLYETEGKISFDTEVKISKNKIENKFYSIEISSAGLKKLYFKEIRKNIGEKIDLISSIDKDLIIQILKLKIPKFIIPILQKIASFIFKLKFNTGELWAFNCRLKPAPEGYYEQEEVKGVGEEFEIGKKFFKSGNYKDKISTGYNGPVRKSLISKSSFIDESERNFEIILYNEIPRIDYNVSIKWLGREKTMINIAFPFNIENNDVIIDIPFCLYKLGEEVKGFWDHPENVAGFKARGIQDFIDISNNEFGITISSDWPCFDFTFFPNCNLLFSDTESAFFFGDFYRKKGVHKFKFSLYPHKKNSKIWKFGKYLNHPLVGFLYKEKNKAGILPDILSFCETSDDNIIINCIKKEEGGNNLIVRFYEVEGKENEISIKFNFKVISSYLCNILEEKEEKLETKDNIIKIKVKPYNIYTIKVEF